MKIAYVILHYMAGKDTIECIESILKVSKESSHIIEIVVVDNASTNDSFQKIELAFRDNDQVHLIKNKENYGFAKGNNIGFKHAKFNLNADFIVMLNNDTILEQIDFNEVLIDKYKNDQYFVLGPDILTADGFHQNPGNKQEWGIAELNIFRIKKIIQIILSYFIKKKQNSKSESQKNYLEKTLDKDVKNTILHGACWIFSPAYIKKFDGIYNETFLYMEEDILKLHADYYGFLMMYTNQLQIYHKEDAATNMVASTDEVKFRNKNKHLIHSATLYIRLKTKMIMKKRIYKLIEYTVSKLKKSKYEIDYDLPIGYMINLIFERLIMLFRGFINTLGMNKSSKKVFLGKNVKLKCKSKMKFGSGVTIQNNVYLDALSKSGLTLGNGCNIGSGTIIRCSGNFKQLGVGFFMGNNSSLADNCFVGATGGVFIGNDVIGGQNIRFHSSNHVFEDTSSLIRLQGVTAKGIHIGNNCWIGAGVVFCDGVTIGNGCVIGANSVVTKSFPDNCVIAGVPAKVIKIREVQQC